MAGAEAAVTQRRRLVEAIAAARPCSPAIGLRGTGAPVAVGGGTCEGPAVAGKRCAGALTAIGARVWCTYGLLGHMADGYCRSGAVSADP